MASGDVSAAIEDFLGGIDTTPPAWDATPLLFENKNTDQGGNALPREDADGKPLAFVEVSFSGRSYGQKSIGAGAQADNLWDEDGTVSFDVLVARGTGSRLARTYAKQLADLFKGRLLLSGHLEFGDAQLGGGAPDDKRYNGNYYVIPVDIEWRRHEA